MGKINIPAMGSMEIEAVEFLERVVKQYLPDQSPKFSIKDLVYIDRVYIKKIPGVVVSIEVRQKEKGWLYSVALPRIMDGLLEISTFYEKDLTKIEETENG